MKRERGRMGLLESKMAARQAFMEDRSTAAENSNYIGTHIGTSQLRLKEKTWTYPCACTRFVPDRSNQKTTRHILN